VKFCRLLICAILVCLCALPAGSADKAEQLFKAAQKAEHDGHITQAYVLYAQAAAADPNNFSYWQHAENLRPMASLMKDNERTPTGLPADQVDQTLFGSIADRDLDQARKPLPPAQLKAAPGRHDYDLRGDSKALWEQVAKDLNLLVLFDTQYQPTKSFHFQLDGVDYRETLVALEQATGSFLTPVSDRLIFVANDTTQKRTEFEGAVAVVVPFPETLTVQELQEVATGLRGTLDMQKVMVDTQRHLIIMRDRVTKVRLAEKILQDLMRPRAQVAVDVEILVTDRSSSLSYGLSTPTAFPLVSFLARTNLANVIPSGYTSFLAFGGGASMLGLGITAANLFANISKSDSTLLLASEVVALDGQPASLHVGSKYPIVTNQYIGNTSATAGQVYTPPPTISFEDLGLLLKITPKIHGPDEVSLDVDAEFKVLGASSNDGIPVVANTKYESKVRLAAGEWAVLAGLMTKTEATTITGIPGISRIPFLRSNTLAKDDGQTLIVLKPHIQILPPTEFPTFRAWSGSETRWAASF
jgi:general secretion pathway protein D